MSIDFSHRDTALRDLTKMHPEWIVYACVLLVMSSLTFFVYGWDKRQSGTRGWRVPEQILHILAFLGGWPGAFAAQRYFRHKTKKASFRQVFLVIVGLHLTLVGIVAYAVYILPFSEE